MQPQDLSAHYQQVEEEAANWICERDEGLSPERERSFLLWLNQDPLHQRAFDELTQTVSLLEEMPMIVGASASHATSAGSLQSAATPKRPWAWIPGLAAAAAVAVAAFTWSAISTGPRAEIYQTDGDQPRRLALADGSVVDLNGHSQLAVTLAEKERRVTLVKGEAHFQVAHDTERPFIVTANEITVRAVGTAFDVKLSPDRISVLVVEGKVQLATARAAVTPSASAVPLMMAGDQAEMTTTEKFSPRISQADPGIIRTSLAWQNRLTNFEDVPLREIVARINRCTGSNLVVADEDLGARRIGGVIALNQVEAFLELLQRDNEIVVERHGTEIVLRRMH